MSDLRDYIKDGAEIYRRSFATIRREADLTRFQGLEEKIAVRIIHACGMVEMALQELQKSGVVELDEERKAAMVSNLLVVLCSDQNAQPIINTGTLYN